MKNNQFRIKDSHHLVHKLRKKDEITGEYI